MRCNTILYSKEGYFLAFEKRENAFFFHEKNGTSNIIYPDGHPIVNGAGLFTFPESDLNDKEKPFKGCLRAFIEACGSNISFCFTPKDYSQSLLTLRIAIIDGGHYEILFSRLNTVPNNYHSLYLEFSIEDLKEIQSIVRNINIGQANLARVGICENVIQEYHEIFVTSPFCPLDDKLANSELWQIEKDATEIKLLQQNKATGSHFDIIEYLANDILNTNITF
ncbi:MAG: hypothetical protein JXR05_04960 [Flavobacteriaceae bacterium]